MPPPSPHDPTPPHSPALVVAILLLNLAVASNNGLYSPLAVALLLAAVAAFAAGFIPRLTFPPHSLRVVGLLAVAIQSAVLLAGRPLNDIAFPNWTDAWVWYLAFGVASAACLLIPLLPPLRRPLFALALVAVAAGGTWIIRTNPAPRVDVWVYQHDAAAELLAGRNPYRMTFPNPYSANENWVFAPDTTTPDRILFGFPYLPATLLPLLPAHLVPPLSDYRYTHLAAILATATLLLRVRPHPFSDPYSDPQSAIRNPQSTSPTSDISLPASLLLTHPRLPWYLEWGWTEPLTGLLLVATLFAALRQWRALPVLLGLLLASKQYMVVLVPLIWLLAPPARRWRFTLATLATAAVVTLPLVLWDPAAFWRSAVALQFAQPFRPDALSAAALLYHTTGLRLPGPLALAAALAAAALLAARLRPSPRAFILATAIVLPVLFVLSKQAFANYYLLVAVAWCALLATPDTDEAPIAR